LNSLMKNLIFWAIIFIVLLLLFQLFAKPRPTVPDKTYSDFLVAVESGRVHEAETAGGTLPGKRMTENRNKTYAPEDPEMIKLLREKRVVINAKRERKHPWYIAYLVKLVPHAPSRWFVAVFHETNSRSVAKALPLEKARQGC